MCPLFCAIFGFSRLCHLHRFDFKKQQPRQPGSSIRFQRGILSNKLLPLNPTVITFRVKNLFTSLKIIVKGPIFV